MSERRIIRSASATTRLAELTRWLLPRLNQREILILCSHLESADHLARCLAAHRGALFGVRRLTLDVLAYQLALPELVEAGLSPHSRLAEEAIAARVVQELVEAGELAEYEDLAHWPGFARALASTLTELRLHEVDASSLAHLHFPHSQSLSRLLERYEATSVAAGVADRAQVFQAALRAAETLEQPPLGLTTVILDVALPTPLEAKLMAALALKAPEVLATVPAGDKDALEPLEHALGGPPVELPAGEDVSEGVGQLQRFLFSEASPPPPAHPPASGQVLILSAPGEAQEAVEIARQIQEEAENGVRFDDMAVLLRATDVYTPLLEDAFTRAGIPAFFADGTLRPDPAGRAFLALLDCAGEQLSASRFAEYLSLGQIPEIEGDGDGSPLTLEDKEEEDTWAPPRHAFAPAPPPAVGEPLQLELFAEPEKIPQPEDQPAIEGSLRTPWRWERLLVDAAVIGGRDRWERRLSGLERELTERLKELDDPDAAQAAFIQRQIDDLEHLKRVALPLIGTLAELPTKAPWRNWLDALESLARRALAQPEGVLSLLAELRPMESVGPVELFEVRQVLSERLTLLPQEPPSYRYGRVWVAPIEAARGVSFEVVLVPGLAERMFPKKIMEDPLLLDRQRQSLSQRLPLQEDRVARERLVLRLAAGAARRKVVFSYPSVDLQKGRSKVPSFYLLEVARASQGALPDFEALERAAAASSGARLGWPAPRQPARAIDRTELDLAFLAEALRSDADADEAHGAGRYLLTASPALARSLRARFTRSRAGRFFPSDGLLEPSAETKPYLEAQRFAARAYSVTALEKYAACPYRFFLHAILKLRPREAVEPVTHMDALTRGRIMHEAQFEILKELEAHNLLPLRPERLSAALDICEHQFKEVARRFAEELAPAIDRIWRDELDRIRTDLRGWLRRESEAGEHWVPLHREYTFGMRPRGLADPASVVDEAVLANGLRLRGAIDLVERNEEGKARVTDHKSGRAWVPPNAIVNGGQTLQPILYALAYEALTGRQVAEARLYYCTQVGGYQQRRIEPDEEALRVVDELYRRMDAVIEEGFFPACPKPPLGCNYCDYRPVCGPRADIDAERKQADPRLSPLNWLRNLT